MIFSEKKLNISTIVADAMMDKVIQQLEKHQAKLVRKSLELFSREVFILFCFKFGGKKITF